LAVKVRTGEWQSNSSACHEISAGFQYERTERFKSDPGLRPAMQKRNFISSTRNKANESLTIPVLRNCRSMQAPEAYFDVQKDAWRIKPPRPGTTMHVRGGDG